MHLCAIYERAQNIFKVIQITGNNEIYIPNSFIAVNENILCVCVCVRACEFN